ncbi:MAG: DUF742 domain-containing protein [Pseudonocardiaceae bacterium]|nr:DUF742 domain-containing protein [Pseudonocardiaceae bacterium]
MLDNLAPDSEPPRRRSRARHEAEPSDSAPADPAEPEPPAEPETPAAASHDGEGWYEPEDVPSAVRPYARTGGRTHPVLDLAVETLVMTSERGRDAELVRSVEHVAIAELCEQTHSVAEVSALLRLPLGVARVLLADMADAELVDILRNPAVDAGAPDLPLLERVLSGLRKL